MKTCFYQKFTNQELLPLTIYQKYEICTKYDAFKIDTISFNFRNVILDNEITRVSNTFFAAKGTFRNH